MSSGSKIQKAAYRKRYKLLHPEKIRSDKKSYKARHPELTRANVKRSIDKARLDCISHYSAGRMICANCGESHIEFLEIDHINGGGKQHRRDISGNLYQWLRSHGYPDGFQILCSNCNHKKVATSAKVRGETGSYEQQKYYRRNSRLKAGVFAHYLTNGEVKCACCMESDPDVLCIDHINGNGNTHRKEIGNPNGGKMYAWLKRNNYPPGFRILCHNCNQSLGTRGYCPHHPEPVV